MIETGLQLEHILNLLDDESREIQKILRQTILDNSLDFILGKDSIYENLSETHRRSLDELYLELHFELVHSAMQQLLSYSLEDLDLEKAVLLLAYWNSSRVDLPAIVNELDEIAGEIRKSIPTTGHPLSFIDTVSEFLNKNMGFRGNSTDYYNPDNSFIDKVLKTKTGIPITLSTIYILIARRLDLPILGVPMPAHFIVKYDDGTDEIFFDPFYGGKVYSRQECLKYLEQADIEDHNKVLDGCSNFDIILRMMRNIHLVYSSYKDEPQKITEIEQLLSLVEQNFK
ncbi:MAG: transglutaminase-like domain-containing protein [Calditrichia bacterium]